MPEPSLSPLASTAMEPKGSMSATTPPVSAPVKGTDDMPYSSSRDSASAAADGADASAADADAAAVDSDAVNASVAADNETNADEATLTVPTASESSDPQDTMIVPETSAAPPIEPLAQQALRQDFHHDVFGFEEHVKNQLNLRLDHEATLCPSFLATGTCPLIRNCPLRHVPRFIPSDRGRDATKRTVCKHWLRGLCKKGDSCDYLHEYDMRSMPECRFFATFGFCDLSNGSERECLYLHRDPKTKRRECEEYKRGFCPHGPTCSKKHIRKVLCPRYLAGFCPLGPTCLYGHPKSTPPNTEERRTDLIQTVRPLTPAEAFAPPPHLAAKGIRAPGGDWAAAGRDPAAEEEQRERGSMRGRNRGRGGGGGGGGGVGTGANLSSLNPLRAPRW